MSPSGTCAFGGIGTCPQTPWPPFFTFSKSLASACGSLRYFAAAAQHQDAGRLQSLGERHLHGREAGGVLAHLGIKERDAALGGVDVAHLAGKCREACERPGRSGVAARRRLVLPRLRPVKEL